MSVDTSHGNPEAIIPKFDAWTDALEPYETPYFTYLKKSGYFDEPDHGYTPSPHPYLLKIAKFVELPRLFGGVIHRWTPQPIWSEDQLERRRAKRTFTWGPAPVLTEEGTDTASYWR